MSINKQRQLSGNLTAQPKPTRQVDSPYLTALEAVAYLRLGSLTALYRLAKDHRLPYGRRGRLYIFDTRKIDRWVESSGSRTLEIVRTKAS